MLSAFLGELPEARDDELAMYAASLTNAPEAARAIEKGARMLNLFANLRDVEGQIQACDALTEMCRAGAGAPARAIVEHDVLPALVSIVQAGRTEPCRAAAELTAELCGGAEQRRAVVRSGMLKPLISLLRKASEPRLLREGARLLAALADAPSALGSMLREGAPRALKHLCR